jgi:hypothetical protein
MSFVASVCQPHRGAAAQTRRAPQHQRAARDAATELKETPVAKWLYNFGCVTTMDIAQLVYRPHEPQGASKDYEFSRATVEARWAQGHADACTTLTASPWLAPIPKEVGIRVFDVIHDLLVARSGHARGSQAEEGELGGATDVRAVSDQV